MKVTVTIEIETGSSVTVGTAARSTDRLGIDPEVIGRAIEEASRVAGAFEQTWALARAIEKAIQNTGDEDGNEIRKVCKEFLSDDEETTPPSLEAPSEPKNA